MAAQKDAESLCLFSEGDIKGEMLHNNGIKPSAASQRNFKSPVTQQFKSPLTSKTNASTTAETRLGLKEEINALERKLKDTKAEIEDLEAAGYKESELQTHIDKLHEYNEIKDAGQMVLGRLAVLEGVQTKDLYERYGLELKD